MDWLNSEFTCFIPPILFVVWAAGCSLLVHILTPKPKKPVWPDDIYGVPRLKDYISPSGVALPRVEITERGGIPSLGEKT